MVFVHQVPKRLHGLRRCTVGFPGDLLTNSVLPPLAAELDQYVFQDTQLEGLSKDLFSKSGEANLGSASVSS